MPAWNKYEAGRRDRDAFEGSDYYEAPRREPANQRIERLTRTATSLGGNYDPRHSDGRDEDLDAVADELDRLLSDKEAQDQMRASGRRRPARKRSATAAASTMEDVLGALDRLDQQVQGLSGQEDEAYEPAPRRRPGRYARSMRQDEAFEDPGYDTYDDEDDDYGYAPRRARAQREASLHVYKDLGRRIDALRAPQEQALNQVREELGSLRDALGGLTRGANETVTRQNAELRRLADMVERLRADKKNDLLAKEIRKEVADLKTMVGRTNVEGALQTLEHGYSHILQRLDELSRASVDPRILRGVTARLNEIEDAFAALPRSEHMMVLEDRVVTIAERMEELLQRKGHAEMEPLRAELREVRGFVEQIDIKGLVEGIDDRMKFVSSRLDDLEVLAREQRGLDSRLSAMEQRMPEPETISRLQGRLEDIVGMMADDRAAPTDNTHLSQMDQRLDDIVERLERMEQAGPLPSADAGSFAALEDRLESISGKIDAIERKASRPVPVLDAAGTRGGAGVDTKFLTQLQERLNDLTTRLDQPRDTVTTSDLDKLREEIGQMRASVGRPSSTEALEQRIADLAQIVSRGAEVTDDSRFDQLGEKVAALAAQIENTATKAISADQFTPVLRRIEQNLLQTRVDVAGIAKKAAEEVVAKAPAQSGNQYDEAITALQGDLKRLLDAAEGSEERTRNTFDGVKSVLSSLTERLDNLERTEVLSARPTAHSEPFTPQEPVAPAAPYVQQEPVAPYAQPDTAGSYMPHEPEIAATPYTPVLSDEPESFRHMADVAGVSAERRKPEAAASGSERTEDRARDRKADFIAAARRAAQAAAAEAAEQEKLQNTRTARADEDRGKARVGWLRNVLRRDRSAPSEELQEDGGQDEALELGNEDISDRVFEAEDTRVFPGDRLTPEAAPSSGGRKRAILYAAAAVVLLIGTLQVYRMATGSSNGGDQVASAVKPPMETAQTLPAGTGTPSVAKTAEMAAPVNQAAEVEVSSAPEASTPPAAVVAEVPESPRAVPMAQAPAEPVNAGQAAKEASASGTLAPETNLTFAPPAGVASSFGTEAPQSPSGFVPSDKASGSEEAPSNIIANLPPEGVGPMALRSAAAGGNPAAEFLVGVKYTEGNGVPADMAKAAVWYQKAAEKGLAPAQYRLASLYEKGRGVVKDIPKAKAWYAKAAEAGNAKAMHNLAVLYAEGGGEQPDYAAAAKWFEQAANFGVKDSLFNLGILYAGGIGVDKDLVASYKWFAIAADQGDPEAAKRRDDVANMMDQETLANARLAVETFKLKTPDAAANKVSMEPGWSDSASLPAEKAAVTVVDDTGMIREAQEKLNYLGFDTGTPDGQMGPRTRSAIRAFQRSLGLPETGEVDKRLIEELNSQAI